MGCLFYVFRFLGKPATKYLIVSFNKLNYIRNEILVVLELKLPSYLFMR